MDKFLAPQFKFMSGYVMTFKYNFKINNKKPIRYMALFYIVFLVSSKLIKIPYALAVTPSSITISCTADAPVYINGQRIFLFHDSAGRYCKAFVDKSSTEGGYDLRDIYDINHKLYISAVFDLKNRGRLSSEVVFDTNTGRPNQYILWTYPSADTVIQTNYSASSVITSKSTTVGGALKRVEEYSNGRLNLRTEYSTQTIQQKLSVVATTYDIQNRIIRTIVTTRYNKGENINNLDPNIMDYLDNVIPVTTVNSFDPATGIKKSLVQQIKTASGKISQYNILDPTARIAGTLSRKYYDPLLGRNFSNIDATNGHLRNGYSLTYFYSEAQLRKMRRQQLAAGEIFSDLGTRTNYTADWYNYPAPTASQPCPGSTSTERCLNVDLRDIFAKELDLVSTLPLERKKHIIAFIGDSITFQRTPGHPTARSGDIYLNQGVPGDGTTQILNRLNIINRSDVKIDGIFLMVGINNFTGIFREEGPPSFNQVNTLSSNIAINIGRVVQKIHEYQPNAKVFVMSVTPVSIPINVKWLRTSHITLLNSKIAENINTIAQNWNELSYLDIGSTLLDSSQNGDPKYLQADGLHLNLQGQSRTGRVIKEAIENQFP